MLTRREFTAAGLGLVASPSLLALLDACGAGSSAPAVRQTGPEASGGKLQIAWWGGSDRAKRTQQVLDLFTKTYSKWSFDSSFTGFNAYWDKIHTQAAGGALPDIIQMDMRYIGQFTQRNQLLDLTCCADSTRSAVACTTESRRNGSNCPDGPTQMISPSCQGTTSRPPTSRT